MVLPSGSVTKKVRKELHRLLLALLSRPAEPDADR